MKISVWFLSLLFAFFTVACVLPANAQEAQEGGARWHFKPTVIRQPGHYQNRAAAPPVQHSVRNGSVPRGNAIFDPSIFKPAAAPMHPMQGVHGSMAVPRTTAQPFSHEFGRPVGEQNAQAGRLPPSQPMRAAAPNRNVKVAGRLKPQAKPNNVRIARARSSHPAVQSYAPGQGYEQGPVGGEIAAASESSRSVSGKIVKGSR